MREQTNIRQLPGVPTEPGYYIQVFLPEPTSRREGFANLVKADLHPEGWLYTNAGRMDQMPGMFFGPMKTENDPPDREPYTHANM